MVDAADPVPEAPAAAGARGRPIPRDGARVLLLDAADRLLLFRGSDPGDPGRGWWWFTPGGGRDAGETFLQAAVRELAEETGLCLAEHELSDPVWHRVSEFDFCGRRYRQREQFFLARVPSWEVDTSGFSVLEREAVRDPRWWALDELARTGDTVFPPGLAERVAALVGARTPDVAGGG